jgi:hypothetical protein
MSDSQGRDDATGRPALEPALEELRRRLADDLEAVLRAVRNLDQMQADWKAAPARCTHW